MRRQGRRAEDDTWIMEEDLARLRPDLLEPLPSALTCRFRASLNTKTMVKQNL